MAITKVGRIWLMGMNGRVSATVNYDVPTKLRESVLDIGGSRFRSMRQEPNGTWVYRYEAPAPTMVSDPNVKDARNDQDPDWDGPIEPKVIATFDTLAQHFEHVRHLTYSRNHGLSHREFEELYQHFLAARQQKAFTWT